MSLSKLKPFMTYLDDVRLSKLRSLSKRHKMPMSVLVREGIDSRLATEDKHLCGYNDGVSAAIATVKGNDVYTMRFPSGKTFAELLTEDLQRLYRKANENQAPEHGKTTVE